MVDGSGREKREEAEEDCVGDVEDVGLFPIESYE